MVDVTQYEADIAMNNWDERARLCGNCAFWPLQGYQFDWQGSEPLGTAGYATDGTVSDCRKAAPIGVSRDSPGKTAVWPKTERTDCCGDFQRRPQTHRRERPDLQKRPMITAIRGWW